MTLLIAPRATPSTAAKASTSAGLITRLNELTSDSPKAPNGTDHQGQVEPADGVGVGRLDR